MSQSDSGESNGSTESSNSSSNDSAKGPSLTNNKKIDSSPGDDGASSPHADKNLNFVQSPPPKRSPRRLVQATELRFQCIEGRTSLARVAILLCNISDRPLYYKFKTDTMDLLSALPSATGHIAARGSSRVVLTWQRPKTTKTWQSIASPKLLLVTRFLDSGGITRDTTSTRLIAFMDPSSTCPSDNPPTEQLMLDALSKSAGNDPEITVTKSSDNDSASHPLESPSNLENQNPNVTLALIFLAVFVAVCLYRALNPVAVVVRN